MVPRGMFLGLSGLSRELEVTPPQAVSAGAIEHIGPTTVGAHALLRSRWRLE